MIADKDDELLEIINEDTTGTGIYNTRDYIHKNRLYHNETTIFIINGDNILLERRSKNKRIFPLMLCAPGGHVIKGETIKQNAIKELKEEIGLEVRDSDLKYLMTFKKNAKKQNCIQNVFYVYTDKKIYEFQKQDSEVEELIYMNIDEFIEKCKNESSDVMYNYYEEKTMFEVLKRIVKKGVLV